MQYSNLQCSLRLKVFDTTNSNSNKHNILACVDKSCEGGRLMRARLASISYSIQMPRAHKTRFCLAEGDFAFLPLPALPLRLHPLATCGFRPPAFAALLTFEVPSQIRWRPKQLTIPFPRNQSFAWCAAPLELLILRFVFWQESMRHCANCALPSTAEIRHR